MNTAIKERSIIFNADQVIAIREGRQTQTLRVIKTDREPRMHGPVVRGPNGTVSVVAFAAISGLCPFGKEGDLLWVREPFYHRGTCGVDVNGDPTFNRTNNVFYIGDQEPKLSICESFQKRPSRHMPRWASRITLEITNVRVKRLQDISEEDAKAEGVERHLSGGGWVNYLRNDSEHIAISAKASFSTLWDSIYGKDKAKNWIANPWVWVIEFVIKK